MFGYFSPKLNADLGGFGFFHKVPGYIIPFDLIEDHRARKDSSNYLD